MKALNTMFLMGAMALMLAGSALAQTPPAQNPPAQTPPAQQTPPQQPPAKPPATTPPATTPPATQPPPVQPPKPFPEGAKIAYVNVQAIASNSIEGKAATTKLEELKKKKTAELGEKNKKLQDLQTKLQQGGSVLNDQARNQLEKDIEKTNREIQFFQQDASTKLQEMQNDLQNDFQTKLNPILDQIAKEKGLHVLLDGQSSGAVWADPGLDLTAEVIKRFDAASKTPPVKK
jgi:outer membrane protein